LAQAQAWESLPSAADILAGRHSPIETLAASSEPATAGSAAAEAPGKYLNATRQDYGAIDTGEESAPEAPKPLTFGLIRLSLGGASVDDVMTTHTLRVDWMNLSSLEALESVSQGAYAGLRGCACSSP
jgi:hypothetical protein